MRYRVPEWRLSMGSDVTLNVSYMVCIGGSPGDKKIENTNDVLNSYARFLNSAQK